jgi:hypothetical protein
MGPRNAYKDLLDNVVSPITCVSMNHQNQLEQMANGAMFATILQRNNRVLPLYDCVLCSVTLEETVEHLFLNCVFA